MSRLETLNTLLEREQRRRDDARGVLQGAERALQAARQQQQSLTEYRASYCERWSAQFARGGAIEIVRCYQSFVERLDHAIQHQVQLVQQAGQRLAHAQAGVHKAELRVATVERLLQRHQAQLRLVQARREQKQMDELAMRRRPQALGLGLA